MGLFDMFKREEEIPKADRLVLDDEPAEVDTTIEEESDDEIEKSAPEDREQRGPFDEPEAPEVEFGVVDFGAIRVPVVQGLSLRMEVSQQTQQLVAIALDLDGSTLQVQAFAAPRSSGVWHEVRDRLSDQVIAQQGSAEQIDSDLGPALHAQVPSAKGGPRDRHVEFYGVDGPRWFLRGVLTGEATTDAKRREAMLDLFRSIVVVRGSTPIPPRDLLPLQVPAALVNQMNTGNQQANA